MNKLLKNIGWSSLEGVYTQIVSILTLTILMKLLPPKIFGILAILNIFIHILHIFINAGFSQALIQRQNLSKNYYSTVFWLNMLLGLLLYLALLLVTPYIAEFFNEDLLRIYFPIALIPILISSTFLVHQTIIEKNLQFKTKAVINVAAVTLGAVFSISLAYGGFGIWALIWPTILTSSTTALLYWIVVRWNPKLHFSIHEAKDLFNFGAYLTGSQLVGSITRKSDDILIGKYLNSSELGIYSVAYKILMFPLAFIKTKISSVLFPTFSSYNHPNKIYDLHIKATKLTLMIISPIFMIVFLVNKEVIQLLLSEEWHALSEVTTVFAITSVFISIGYPVQVLYSLGQSKKVFYITLCTRAIFFLLILISILYFKDLLIVSIFISIGLIQHNIIANIYGVRALKQNVRRYFEDTIWKTICPYLLPALLIYSAAHYLNPFPQGTNAATLILAKCLIFIIFAFINPRVKLHFDQILQIVHQYVAKQIR